MAQPQVKVVSTVCWPKLPWIDGTLITAALALYIAMAEVSRLAGDVPDAAGRSWEFSNVMGPSTLFDRSTAGWEFLFGSGDHQTIKTLLAIYLVLDFFFIFFYSCALLRIALRKKNFTGEGTPTLLLLVTGSLVILDLLENVVALVNNSRAPIAFGPAPQWPPPSALPIISSAKWWMLALLIVLLMLPLFRPHSEERAALRRALYGLWFQRFSVVALLPIAVLGLFPGPNLLDQFPDVQRQWVSDGRLSQHAFLTAVTFVIYFLVVFIFGRLRADRVYRLNEQDAEEEAKLGDKSPEDKPALKKAAIRKADWYYAKPKADLLVWLVGPVVILFLAVVFGFAGGPVSKVRVSIFCGAFLGVALVSWLLRIAEDSTSTSWWLRIPGVSSLVRKWGPELRKLKKRLGEALEPLPPRIPTQKELYAVVKAGDVLACAVFVVGGVGLVRSFTAPVALAKSLNVEQPAASYVLLVAGVVMAVSVWYLVHLFSDKLEGVDTSDDNSSAVGGFARVTLPGVGEGTEKENLPWIFLVVSFIAFLAIGAWPVWLARTAGVIAIVIGALAALSIAIGSIVLFEQNRPPPELLRLLRIFRITPVVTILLLVIVFSSATGDDAAVHGIRERGPVAGTIQRPTLDRAFNTWVDQPHCTHAASVAGHAVRLRPMLLVGAEGGGIRAAYWTAAAMERISNPKDWRGPGESVPGCSASAPFLSSGASGGAVGLTVARFSATPVSQLREMAKPDALGAATDGLLVRDLLFSATGLPLPVLGSDDLFPGDTRNELGRWEDRAGLIELVWQRQSPSLNTQFLATVPARNGLVGELALNSTAAGTGCRMLVSTVTLDQRTPNYKPGATAQDLAAQAPAAATCDAVGDPAPFSSDTLSLYGPGAAVNGTARNTSKDGRTDTGCVATMSAATAAMLASRFPYVTPSGVIGGCGLTPQQQLIDGGYTENYGLGTLADLSNQWLGQISNKNAAALRTLGQPGVVPEIIVPIVVYMDNGTGSDLSTPTTKNTNELLIPQQGKSTGGTAQSDSPAQLQRLAALVGVQQTGTTSGQKTSALWCTASQAICNEVTKSARDWAPRPVIVVHQRTAPAVTAPLGWVLSESSIKTMDEALTEQQNYPCPPPDQEKVIKPDNPLVNDAVCKRGYGSLFDVISLLRSP